MITTAHNTSPRDIAEYLSTSVSSLIGSTLGTWGASTIASAVFTSGISYTPAILTGTLIGSFFGAGAGTLIVRCCTPSDHSYATTTTVITTTGMLVCEIIGTAVAPAIGIPYATGCVIAAAGSMMCCTPISLVCVDSCTESNDNDYSDRSSVGYGSDLSDPEDGTVITDLRALLLGNQDNADTDIAV